jgi:YHS domain-containing protein
MFDAETFLLKPASDRGAEPAASQNAGSARPEKRQGRLSMFRFVSGVFLPLLLAFGLALATAPSASGSSSKSPVDPVNSEDRIAVKGYDPVAYFTNGQPTAGLEQYSYTWKGKTYRFGSADNLQRFKADPAKYVPQYGGYCAFAMSIDRIADIDPKQWAIVDGKLYLNNNFFSQTLWSLNKGSRIESADRNWAVYPKTPEPK